MDDTSLCGVSVDQDNSAEVRCSGTSPLGDQPTIDGISDELSRKMKIDGRNVTNTNTERRNHVEGYHAEDCEEDGEEDEDDEDLSEDAFLAQMGYGDSAAPKRDKIKEPQKQYYCDDDEEEEDLSEESILAQMGYLKKEPTKHEPITTPTAALNLVSAFKGSRSKDGKSDKERRVSWAPDVYDPPPTSDEHYAASKTERHKNEQKVKGVAGKNRQKGGGKGSGADEFGGVGGKGSKGGGIKGTAGGAKAAGKDKEKKHADKKQVKKHGGSSSSKYSNFDEY